MTDTPSDAQQPAPTPDAASPDLFLSYNSSDRETVLAVRDALRERGVCVFLDRERLAAGLPWIDALEDALKRAAAVAVFVGRDGLGGWQTREMSLALDRQAAEEKAGRKFPVIPVLLPGADVAKAPGFLLLGTWADLRGWPDEAQGFDALACAVRGRPSPPLATGKGAELPPYRALEAFREEDEPLFFGRELFADTLLRKVLSAGFVAVVGPSGSGKSSVVQAGLLPRLRRERPPAVVWDSVIFKPGSRPFHRLAAALVAFWAEGEGPTGRVIEAEELGNRLASDEASQQVSFDAAFAQALEKARGAGRLLVVIDQFEDILTMTPEPVARSFVARLLEASRAAPVTVVITLRADFYGRAIALSRDLSDLMQDGLVNLGPMRREELRLAVERPAAVVGLRFQEGLVDRILDHLEAQPGNLPLLEFALTELWQRRQGGLLTNQQYNEIGEIEGAVSKRAEAEFGKLRPEQQEVALRLLTRLVRVSAAGEEGSDTRQRLALRDLDDDTRAVTQSFVEARLLVTDYNNTTGEATIEVAHEAIIRHWTRLRDLLERDRQFLLWRQRLDLLMSEWHRADKDAALLLRGPSLLEARRRLKERAPDLTAPEQHFIRASEHAARRPRRWAAAAAVLVLLALFTAAGWAWWSRSDANQVRLVRKDAPELVNTSEAATVNRWLKTLALTGRTDEALADVRGMKQSNARVLALHLLVEALAGAGRIDEALRVAREPGCDEGVFVAIARAQAKAGMTDEALNTARQVGGEATRRSALSAVAQALGERGQSAEAARLAAEVIAQKPRFDSPPFTRGQDDLLLVSDALIRGGEADRLLALGDEDRARLAGLFVRAGRADEAMRFSEKIKDPESRYQFMVNLALALSKHGETDAALALAPKLPGRAHRFYVYALLTFRLADEGKTEEAERAARSALSGMSQLTAEDEDEVDEMPQDAHDFFITFMNRLIRLGKTDELTATLSGLSKDPKGRAAMFVMLAKSLAGAGKKVEAEQAAKKVSEYAGQVTSPSERADAITYAAMAYGYAGQGEEALMIMLGSRAKIDPYHRPAAWGMVAYALAEVGAENETLEAAREVGDDKMRSRILAKLAETMAGKGKIDEALGAVRAFPYAASRPAALAVIAGALAKEGRVDDALALVREIGADDKAQSSALAAVAKAYARQHSYRLARETAGRCSVADDRLSAYTDILREYALQQDPKLAPLLKSEGQD